MKKHLFGFIASLISVLGYAGQNSSGLITSTGGRLLMFTVNNGLQTDESSGFNRIEFEKSIQLSEVDFTTNLFKTKIILGKPQTNNNFKNTKLLKLMSEDAGLLLTVNNYSVTDPLIKNFTLENTDAKTFQEKNNFFEKNRRNIYSSVWAFASLNYLYCDLVGFMDKNVHEQYHNGEIDGTTITPQFLTGAAVMMQIAMANVFLPQVIKNDKTLRWVQITSGAVMTLIQSASLFVGEPTPYYATFSAFEIAATTFITIDAIRWKVKDTKKLPNETY